MALCSGDRTSLECRHVDRELAGWAFPNELCVGALSDDGESSGTEWLWHKSSHKPRSPRCLCGRQSDPPPKRYASAGAGIASSQHRGSLVRPGGVHLARRRPSGRPRSRCRAPWRGSCPVLIEGIQGRRRTGCGLPSKYSSLRYGQGGQEPAALLIMPDRPLGRSAFPGARVGL
jgi:hypothetical protein